jgi:hypothetical protein
MSTSIVVRLLCVTLLVMTSSSVIGQLESMHTIQLPDILALTNSTAIGLNLTADVNVTSLQAFADNINVTLKNITTTMNQFSGIYFNQSTYYENLTNLIGNITALADRVNTASVNYTNMMSQFQNYNDRLNQTNQTLNCFRTSGCFLTPPQQATCDAPRQQASTVPQPLSSPPNTYMYNCTYDIYIPTSLLSSYPYLFMRANVNIRNSGSFVVVNTNTSATVFNVTTSTNGNTPWTILDSSTAQLTVRVNDASSSINFTLLFNVSATCCTTAKVADVQQQQHIDNVGGADKNAMPIVAMHNSFGYLADIDTIDEHRIDVADDRPIGDDAINDRAKRNVR